MTDSWQALSAWWAELDASRRALALAMDADGPLPLALALSLRVRGFHVPVATVGWEAEGLSSLRRVDVQPAILVEFLAGVRCAELSSAA